MATVAAGGDGDGGSESSDGASESGEMPSGLLSWEMLLTKCCLPGAR